MIKAFMFGRLTRDPEVKTTSSGKTVYVRRVHPEIVNDSTSRILRKLRNDGIVNYGVVGARKQGKYTLIGVQGEV